MLDSRPAVKNVGFVLVIGVVILDAMAGGHSIQAESAERGGLSGMDLRWEPGARDLGAMTS